MAKFVAQENTPEGVRNFLLSVEVIIALVTLAVSTGIWIFSSTIVNIWDPQTSLGYDTLINSIRYMTLCAMMRIFEGIYRSSLIGLGKAPIMNIISILVVTMRTAGAVLVLKYYHPSIETFFLWQVIVSIFSILIFKLAALKYIPSSKSTARFDVESLSKIRSFAQGVFFAAIAGTVITQMDKFFVASLTSLSSFGYYAIASTISAGLYQIVFPIYQSYYPAFCANSRPDQHEYLKNMYHNASLLVSFVVGIPASVMLFNSYDILFIWTGDVSIANNAHLIMKFLIIGTTFHCLLYIPYALQLSQNWSSLAVKVNFLAIIIFLPALFLLVGSYGALGASIAWTGVSAIMLIMNTGYMYSKIKFGGFSRWALRDCILPLTVIFGIAALVTFLFENFIFGSNPILIRIALTTIITTISAVFIIPASRSMVKPVRTIVLRYIT